MRGVAVVGTDTGVGKTLVCAALMSALSSKTVYWKPVQTGADQAGGPDDDTTTVRRLAALEPARIVPPVYRFALPASPHHAAAAEGETIALSRIMDACETDPGPETRWVVEGVGGLMVPLSDTVLWPDVLRAMALPVLVVASTRLGTINHTLLTLRQCEAEGLAVLGVVLNGPEDQAAQTGVAQHTSAPLITRLPVMAECTPDAVAGLGRLLLDTTVLGGVFR